MLQHYYTMHIPVNKLGTCLRKVSMSRQHQASTKRQIWRSNLFFNHSYTGLRSGYLWHKFSCVYACFTGRWERRKKQEAVIKQPNIFLYNIHGEYPRLRFLMERKQQESITNNPKVEQTWEYPILFLSKKSNKYRMHVETRLPDFIPPQFKNKYIY